MAHQEANHDRETTKKEGHIDYYCKQFVDFMQTQLHQRYDLISSRDRSRETEQQEETAPQTIPSVLDKGKGKLNPKPARVKVPLNKEINSSKGHTTKEALVL